MRARFFSFSACRSEQVGLYYSYIERAITAVAVSDPVWWQGDGRMDILRRNTDYALRLAVDLAAHGDDEALSTWVLAEREDVSYQLACKLMQKLHAAGLVESDMGPKGGFRLSRTPEEIAIAEVIEAIQGPLRLNRCVLGQGACPRYETCSVRAKIGELQEKMDGYLRSVSLGELVQNRKPAQKQTTKTKGRRRQE